MLCNHRSVIDVGAAGPMGVKMQPWTDQMEGWKTDQHDVYKGCVRFFWKQNAELKQGSMADL